MGCNNADTAKCAKCNRGGDRQPRNPRLKRVDKKVPKAYNEIASKRTQAWRNAFVHKAYHKKKAAT